MKRVFSITAWTTGAFLTTAIVAGLAAAFASGVIAYFLSWNGKSVSLSCIMGWAASIAFIVALAVAVVTLALGVRGRLPGTKPGQ